MWMLMGALGCVGDETGETPKDETPITPTTPAPTTPQPTTDPTTPPTSSPACPPGAQPQLETAQGCVFGAISEQGREQFLGIPYAEPPVGAYRFAPPVPAAPRTEPLQATAFGQRCAQFGDALFDVGPPDPGGEDCLTLNVFRPVGAQDLPVMVFIHGGGHVAGSGTESYIAGDPALAEDVVLVTMNYRLGPLGFLAHPALSAEDPDGVSGNLGLRDVITAVQWVRDNVDALGGDPERLILFGESAGGLETCAVLVSPRAQGLVDAAIIQSAPCTSLATPLRGLSVLRPSAEDQGEAFIDAVGCAGEDVPSCLRALPLETIVEEGQSGIGPLSGSEWLWEPPVDDVWMPDVAAAMQSGAWNQVPVIAVVNKDEGTLFTTGLAPDQAALDQWLDTYALLGVDRDALAALYDPAAYGGSTEAAFAALFGDSAFVCPTVWQQEILSAQVPARGVFWVGEGLSPTLGAYHGIEMPFVFGTLTPFASEEDLALSLRVRSAWRTAADDTPLWSDLGAWPEVSEGWVEIDTDPGRVIAAPRAEACALFEASFAYPF